MTKWTKPDENQPEVTEALERCSFTVFDMHNVPSATGDAALVGLPDLLVTTANGLTLIGAFDPRQVQAALEAARVRDVSIIEGAILTPEVKTDQGKLRDDQISWWAKAGLKPLVLRSWAQVLEFCGRRFD